MTVTIAQLEAALPQLNENDRATARDMIDRSRRWGSFTPKQQAFAESMIRHSQEAREPHAKLDLTGINAMFDRAKAKGLKRMVVRFLDEAGDRFSVSPAAATSRNAGMLYVKSSSDGYLGKIDEDGHFHGAHGAQADAAARAQAALIAFNKDPEGKAKLYGKMTSSCCFCGLELNDPRSVMAGYGPICADNYGLPIPSMAEARAWVARQSAA